MNEAERLALAKRIARHTAPAQVKLDPDAARLELVKLALEKLLAVKTEEMSADDMNRFLYFRGLRPCPHSHHSSDEDFAACVATLIN